MPAARAAAHRAALNAAHLANARAVAEWRRRGVASSPYEVYFVNPRATEILGHPVYPSLAALPVVPDLVDVFRRHDELPTVLEETLAVGARTLWLQLGSWHEEVARLGAAAGLEVVMDRCVKIEHARFNGGLHLAGFDTGVISSRRSLR